MHKELMQALGHAALWMTVAVVAAFGVYSNPEAYPTPELACLKPADPKCGSCRAGTPDGEQR